MKQRLLSAPGRLAAALAVALALAAATAPALLGQTAQSRPAPGNPQPQFSSATELVEVYATVTDARGEPVTGLRQSDFEVFENGRRQQVTTFAAGEFPLTVALGIDRSWSMAGAALAQAKQASVSFIRALKPDDRSMVVAIGGDAEMLAPLSTDRSAQARAIEALDPWSTTALYDAIIASLDRLEGEPGRQALVLFSDGTDRYSTATAAQAVERARRSGALIYPILFGKTRPPVLAELAAVTGGRSFLLRDARELERTLSSIARELRYQYLIGYAPAEAIRSGVREWRSIAVALKSPPPGVRIRARDGYATE